MAFGVKGAIYFHQQNFAQLILYAQLQDTPNIYAVCCMPVFPNLFWFAAPLPSFAVIWRHQPFGVKGANKILPNLTSIREYC